VPWALCWISLTLLLVGLGLRMAHPEGLDDQPFYAVTGMFGAVLIPLVGALIAAHLPANPYGWLWCALGLSYGLATLSDGLRHADVGPRWITWVLLDAAFAAVLGLLVHVLLLFPTGRLPGPGWRWLGHLGVLVPTVVVVLLPFSPPADDPAAPSPWAIGGSVGAVLLHVLDGVVDGMFVLVVLAALSVVVRFRRAGPVERQQLKWFLLAALVAAATIVVDRFDLPISPPVWAVIDGISFALVPAAVGIAVLRYRLYDIDRVISRSVSYGALTAVLIGVYLLVVALLRPLLEPVTGNSSLAVAGSTLAVAAVFNPVRRRLQTVVDRRFDRARYDAARAVDAFAARLRTQVDLDEVTAGLRDTVVATVAPTRVGVWLSLHSSTAVER
jgi:hypothetical protein